MFYPKLITLNFNYVNKTQIIDNTAQYIKGRLSGEASGHDWWHVYRVWKMAKRIGKEENADMFVVELAALLHDISDWKFNDGDDDIGPKLAREYLQTQNVNEQNIAHICEIIKDLSFKGAKVKTKMKTLEGMVVQDADRLDAIGAIGIGRTFAYGGHKGYEMHNPEIKPELHDSFEKYKHSNSNTINHFYEKLLLLKDLMNTKSAKKLAKHRHEVMEEFLKEFFAEWDGNL